MNEDDINYYTLLKAVKQLNLSQINDMDINEEEIKKQLNLKSNVKINIDKDLIILSLNKHKFEEYFLNKEKKFSCSCIKYSGYSYKDEFLGYKLYTDNKF